MVNRMSRIAEESLHRAVSSQALSNLPTIYREFLDRGIPETEIKPRVNVFTFHAWKALGRHVRKGEKGVRITTWIPTREKRDASGKVTKAEGRRPKTAYVFHVSQTDPSATAPDTAAPAAPDHGGTFVPADGLSFDGD
jgi:hypothetical protein